MLSEEPEGGRLDDDPPWSNILLRRLGEALPDKCAPPDGCPDYGAVMLWHNDLAGEVASVISNTRWVNKPAGQFAVTARSKAFCYAAAVVTELGGPMSHAAVVAREFGFPCVVDAQGATRSLPSGALVEVDGATGEIHLPELAPEDSPPLAGDSSHSNLFGLGCITTSRRSDKRFCWL